MKKLPFFLVFLIILVAAGIYYWQFDRLRRPLPMPVEQPSPLPETEPGAGIRHPIDATESGLREAAKEIDPEESLPELKQSDGRMKDVLSRLFPDLRLERFFIFENFIPRFVATVDNLPRKTLPVTHLPTRPAGGQFQVKKEGDEIFIDETNYRRYTPYIRLAEAVEPERVVAVYARFYPLFQEAYENLGYPDGYFNDRLIDVIDHLLETPEVSEPIRLEQPKIRYFFADPELEDLSAGQKTLIRTGPENAGRIKEIVREYRQELTAASERS